MAYIEMKHSYKRYHTGDTEIVANRDVNFEIEKGELVIILGSSGAGKSTVLNILGGMDTVTSGSVVVDGKHVDAMNEKELTDYRRFDIGFVFQFYNLVQNLTALENVELAGQIVKQPKKATDILKLVGLEHRMDNFPSQISGGEQQRVAIARAISKNPKLLLCDEPTGALDYKTGKNILNILKDYSVGEKKTVVIITHNSSIAEAADKVIEIYDAKVKKVTQNTNPKSIDEIEW